MERIFVHEIGLEANGGIVRFVKDESGQVIKTEPFDGAVYSRMKHGCPSSIEQAAQEIFIRIISDTVLNNIILTNDLVITNSSRSVPTASFTIMQVLVEKYLNPYLNSKGSSSVIWIKSKRKGKVSQGDYGTLDKRGRQNRMQKRKAYFEQKDIELMQGKKVILFDDCIVSGAYEENQRKLLTSIGIKDEDIIPIFWIQIYEDTAKNNPQFEKELNYVAVKKLDDLLEFFFNPDLTINARTLKYLLSSVVDEEFLPIHQQELFQFLLKLKLGNGDFSKMDSGQMSINKIFKACVSSDGYSKMERFEAGFKMLDLFNFNFIKTFIKQKRDQVASVYEIDSVDELSDSFCRTYSRMKYSDPVATTSMAYLILLRLLDNASFRQCLVGVESVVLTSSAYGVVPTAANSVSRELFNLLKHLNIDVDFIKVDRYGDFSTTAYGTMSNSLREARMKSRKICLTEENIQKVDGKLVIIVDDVNVTGSHERTLQDVFDKTDAKNLLFSYLINFKNRLTAEEPQTEEYLNRAGVRTVTDLIPFFTNKKMNDLVINARTIKFILTTKSESSMEPDRMKKIKLLKLFLSRMSDQVIKKLFYASYCDDGYHKMPKFIEGFKILLEEAMVRNVVSIYEAHSLLNTVVSCYINIDEDDSLVDMQTDDDLTEIGKKYSLMKFGSYKEIAYFAKKVADSFITKFKQEGSSLEKLFRRAGENNEYIVLVTPGSRNVHSSQNFIFEIAVKRVNTFLALNKYPTIILMNLARLRSNTANYATLSKFEREMKPGETKTLLPGVDLFQYPMHIIFADDVRITGATADRVEKHVLEMGALSFSSIYCVVLDPEVTKDRPGVENWFNNLVIDGALDENVTYILNQPEFRPVQRMVRLVLSKKNRNHLCEYLANEVCHQSLIKLYESALGNDYGKDRKYADSVTILLNVLRAKGLIDADGLVVSDEDDDSTFQSKVEFSVPDNPEFIMEIT